MFDDMPDQPILSDEETGALLDAMREEEQARAPEAREAELASKEAPLREALDRADKGTSLVADAARGQLLKQIAIGVKTEPQPAEIVPRDVIDSSIEPQALIYGLERDGELDGFMVLDPNLATFVLVRCMGAGEDAKPSALGEKLSALDRSIIREFPHAILAAVGEHVLNGRVVTPVALDEAPTAPSSVRFEPMLRLVIRFMFADEPIGELTVALEASGLDEPRAARPTSNARDSLLTHLRGVEVDVTAVLGRSPSSIRALLALSNGDIVRLDGAPGDPVSLCVDEVVVAYGDPVVHKGDLAIQIRPAGGEARP